VVVSDELKHFKDFVILKK
jgi:hypothetical protein